MAKQLHSTINIDNVEYDVIAKTAEKVRHPLTVYEGQDASTPSFTYDGSTAKQSIRLLTPGDITFDSNGAGTTIGVGGIKAGTIFENRPITEVLHSLLYPYVAPTFSSIALSEAAGTFEYGTVRTISKVTPNFTKGSKNITSIKIGTTSGGDDLYSDTNATSGTAITLTNSKTFDGKTGGTIYCTISDGTTSKPASASINYAYFNYVIVSSSATAPTSKGSGTNLRQNYEISSLDTSDNTYIWFLMPTQNKKQIQQFAMNQWNNMNTTYANTVTFTTDTGKEVTYHAYRTDKMKAATGKYRIN